MKVRICVPIPASSVPDAFTMLGRAENAGADLIEIRLDYAGLDASEIIKMSRHIAKQCSTPLIATNRQIRQGGRCRLCEEERIKTLIEAAKAGFTYVDLDLTTRNLSDVVKTVRDFGAKVIISFHDFNFTPPISEMERIAGVQVEAGADICKIVTMANSISDSIKCLFFTHEMSGSMNIVCFAMGEHGLLSRILSPLFGAPFTYASLEGGFETAPGQISIGDLREIYRRLGVQS
ncbi:type I 3-dehydroquinate dehydratase [Candidatus Bathyarchaeota archaeon]|nr:type I 3-dehydroquinate dehydratase [Candidatus Bathyarchaeota archaeon]